MVPKSERQVRWLASGIWSISTFGSITVLLVPALFGGHVPIWFPILTLLTGVSSYFICLKQARRP
jgi:hypothetical protein